MWIDSHAHLYDASESECTDLCATARACGVSAIVNTATCLTHSDIILDQCKREPMLRAVLGISPFACTELPPDWLAILEKTCCAGSGVIGLGEIGIDSTNPRYPLLSIQLPVFETQLALAKKLNLPVIIHSRGAEARALDICKTAGVAKTLFHCFTGDSKICKQICSAGYYVSFSGIITFANTTLTDVLQAAPLEHVLIETDSPYLAPVPHRGKPNQPAWVSLVGKKVAAIKQMAENEVAAQLEHNFKKLFSL